MDYIKWGIVYKSILWASISDSHDLQYSWDVIKCMTHISDEIRVRWLLGYKFNDGKCLIFLVIDTYWTNEMNESNVELFPWMIKCNRVHITHLMIIEWTCNEIYGNQCVCLLETNVYSIEFKIVFSSHIYIYIIFKIHSFEKKSCCCCCYWCCFSLENFLFLTLRTSSFSIYWKWFYNSSVFMIMYICLFVFF
jgi:hypothetical protein